MKKESKEVRAILKQRYKFDGVKKQFPCCTYKFRYYTLNYIFIKNQGTNLIDIQTTSFARNCLLRKANL